MVIPWAEDGAHEGAMPFEALVGIMSGKALVQRWDGDPEAPRPPDARSAGLGNAPVLRLFDAEAMAHLLQCCAPRGSWPEHDGSESAYSRVGRVCAAAVRNAYRGDPRLARRSAVELWQAMTRETAWAWMAEGPSAPSAFQWGWGVNCARRLCEIPPVQNPALVTPGSDVEEPEFRSMGMAVPGGLFLVCAMGEG